MKFIHTFALSSLKMLDNKVWHFSPNWNALFFLDIEPKAYSIRGRGEISRMSFTANSTYMKRKDYSYAGLTLLVEVRVPVLLKAKSYTRVRFGKTEKVSSYYMRIGAHK